MEPINIIQRTLTNSEIQILIDDTKESAHLKYVSKNKWMNFDYIYVAESRGQFVGACTVTKISKWCKIGPLIILKKFRGMNFSQKFIEKIRDEHANYNLYITTSNPAVEHVARKLNFKKISKFRLPLEIYWYFILNINWIFDLKFLRESFRKARVYGLKEHKHFVQITN